MKISVFGLGYVGLSNALCLSQNEEVMAFDIDKERVETLKKRESPISDEYIETYLKKKTLTINFTSISEEAVKFGDMFIICTPTDYNEKSHYFDTRSIESVIETILAIKPDAICVIKSTVPIGYVEKIRTTYGNENIIFSPEFLREGKALYDNLYPSRIIVGDKTNVGAEIARILKRNALEENIPVLLTNPTESECIKLFSNAYLAMRIAYFNELDTYAETYNLDSRSIIEGVSLDPRIGMHYNNPSFGYGGYCLPKDTKQLLANYEGVPNKIISAIVSSNDVRKKFVVQKILEKKPTTVGIYRLIMKFNSDNFRSSAVQEIIKQLQENNIEVLIYEPSMKEPHFNGVEVVNELETFVDSSDIILANRVEKGIFDSSKNKVYTRDIFLKD